jgi:uncharacterized surface protein with fasciclin (FAS1) repeats
MRRLPFFVLLWLAVSLVFLSSAPAKEPKMKDITDTVLSNRIMTKFALLLRYSEMASFLSSRGPFTLFAPTDSAFSRIPPDAFNALEQPENKELLQRIILFHVVNGQRFTAKDMVPLKTLLSCEGHPLVLHVNRSGAQLVSKAKILHADIRCLNGLVHEIDTVLLPPGVSLAGLVVAPAPAVNTVANPAPPTNDVAAPAADSTNAPASTSVQ